MRLITLFIFSILITITISATAQGKSSAKSTKSAADAQQESDAEFKKNLSEMYRRIIRSIQALREQIASNQNVPFLPNLYYQLADLLSQKANVEYYIQKENEGSYDTTTANAGKQYSQVIVSKKEAIDIYKKILDEFPSFAQKADTMYGLALTQYSIDESAEFINNTKKLVAAYPGSEQAIRGQLLMGQYYFDQRMYREASTYLTTVSSAPFIYERNVARYRLGLLALINSQFKESLMRFEQVVTDVDLKESDSPFEVSLKQKSVKSSLKREALIDSIRAYTEVYQQDATPIEYYSRIAPTEAMFQEVIEKLAYRYIYLKRYKFAIKILRTLSERTILPEKVINVYQEVLLMIPLEDRIDLPVEEIRYLLEVYNRWRSFYEISAEFQKQSYNFFEKQVRDLGTRAHLYIKQNAGSIAGSKGKLTAEKVDYYTEKSIDYYKLYLSFFGKSENAVKIATNLADVYFQKKQYMQSGDYYLRTYLGEFGKPIEARKLIENALLCLQKDADYSFYELLRVKGLLIHALESYMAIDGRFKNDPKLNFILVKSVYEQGLYEEALASFIEFMKRFPKTNYAVDAGELILDYFNTKSDYDGLVTWASKILDAKIANSKFNKKVAAIQKQARLKKLQSHVESSTEFDSFAQGKSYLQTAMNIEDSALMNIALQKALSNSKKEKDMDTFFATAKVLAEKESDPNKRADILMSVAQENLRLTRFFAAYEAYKEIYDTSKIPLKTRTNAYLQVVSIALNLRDWPHLNEFLGHSLKSKISRNMLVAISEQVSDYLDSPHEVEDTILEVIEKIGMTDAILLGMYKAQDRLGKSEANNTIEKTAKICSKRISGVLCGWNHLKNLDEFNRKFISAISTSSATLPNIEKSAGAFTKLIEGHSKLEQANDPHLSIMVAMRLSGLFAAFGNFLKKGSLLNQEARQILIQKAQESINTANGYKQKCAKIINATGAVTPANKLCLSGNFTTTDDGKFWNESALQEGEVEEINPSKFSTQEKDIFATNKENIAPVREMARAYYDKKHYNYALATALFGSANSGAGGDFSTIIGCSALHLGYYNEASFHLKRATGYPDIKNSCMAALKKIQLGE